jgi:hypothetical protein
MNSGKMNKYHITIKIALILDLLSLGCIVAIYVKSHVHDSLIGVHDSLIGIFGIMALVFSIIGNEKQKTKLSIILIILSVFFSLFSGLITDLLYMIIFILWGIYGK